jgi:hypothetical protein
MNNIDILLQNFIKETEEFLLQNLIKEGAPPVPTVPKVSPAPRAATTPTLRSRQRPKSRTNPGATPKKYNIKFDEKGEYIVDPSWFDSKHKLIDKKGLAKAIHDAQKQQKQQKIDLKIENRRKAGELASLDSTINKMNVGYKIKKGLFIIGAITGLCLFFSTKKPTTTDNNKEQIVSEVKPKDKVQQYLPAINEAISTVNSLSSLVTKVETKQKLSVLNNNLSNIVSEISTLNNTVNLDNKNSVTSYLSIITKLYDNCLSSAVVLDKIAKAVNNSTFNLKDEYFLKLNTASNALSEIAVVIESARRLKME